MAPMPSQWLQRVLRLVNRGRICLFNAVGRVWTRLRKHVSNNGNLKRIVKLSIVIFAPNRVQISPLLHRNVQRFRSGLVIKAHRLCVSLNSRLESNKEEGEVLVKFWLYA